ncbi:MAG TPA: Amuc_1100 family pilus-like protein [Opitutaceae bacterium]
MNLRLRSPAWGSVEAGLAILVLGSAVGLAFAELSARRSEESWRTLERQRRLAGSGDLAALTAARAHSDQVVRQKDELVARWESALGSGVNVDARDIAKLERAEAFFELAQRVEGFHRQLREAGVAVKETERFGFETYRAAGPSLAVLTAVLRQQDHIARLVDALGASRALALEGIEREAPGAEPAEGQGLADFFVPDPRLRLRLPPELGQGWFRIAFRGETAALRGFLARLAETSPHALVRWIDVARWTDAADTGANRLPPGNGPLRFVVTVAFIDWSRAGGLGTEEVGS